MVMDMTSTPAGNNLAYHTAPASSFFNGSTDLARVGTTVVRYTADGGYTSETVGPAGTVTYNADDAAAPDCSDECVGAGAAAAGASAGFCGASIAAGAGAGPGGLGAGIAACALFTTAVAFLSLNACETCNSIGDCDGVTSIRSTGTNSAEVRSDIACTKPFDLDMWTSLREGWNGPTIWEMSWSCYNSTTCYDTLATWNLHAGTCYSSYLRFEGRSSRGNVSGTAASNQMVCPAAAPAPPGTVAADADGGRWAVASERAAR